MTYTMLFNMLLNIGLLVLIAMFLTELPLVQKLIFRESDSFRSQAALAVLFGSISIISTYTGTRTHGAILNTRVISVLAAGLLGGPWVGMGAAAIGGLHRYLFDIGGFTALSCSLSTLFEGLVGSAFSGPFHDGKIRAAELFFITAATEIGQMAVILLISRPFQAALSLVRQIAVPMILMNSFGMLIFIQTFNLVLFKRDSQFAEQMRLALGIVKESLPHLRKGLYSQKDMKAAAEIIYQAASCSAVLITDTHQILAGKADKNLPSIDPDLLMPLLFNSMQEIKPLYIDQTDKNHPLYPLLKNHSMMAAPLTEAGHPIGSLTIIFKKQWHTVQSDLNFTAELARLFSVQLELSNLEYQKKLRRKAELRALQSQVNPHFLYNALNTISYICQENSDRARELILTLASYYRQTLENDQDMLNLHTELYHVNAYLELEKARFEEKLQVEMKIDDDIDCMVPPFILQPLVENAIRHGADSQGIRFVSVTVCQLSSRPAGSSPKNPSNASPYAPADDSLNNPANASPYAPLNGSLNNPADSPIKISVCDRGHGFSPSIDTDKLLDGSAPSKGVGLRNVHARLRSIYGAEYGLHIETNQHGTCVWFLVPSQLPS